MSNGREASSEISSQTHTVGSSVEINNSSTRGNFEVEQQVSNAKNSMSSTMSMSKSVSMSYSSGSGGPPSATTPRSREINRKFLLSFVRLLQDETLFKVARDNNFDIARLLDYIIKHNENELCKEIITLGTEKMVRRTTSMKPPTPNQEGNQLFNELSTQQVRQIYRCALSIVRYGMVDNRVYTMFFHLYEEQATPMRTINGTYYITRICGGSKNTTMVNNISSIISTPTTWEILIFFHSISHLKSIQGGRQLDNITGNRTGYALQMLCKCWLQMLKQCKCERFNLLSTVFIPYIMYNSSECSFRVLSSRSEGFSTSSQENDLESGEISNNEREINVQAYNRPIDVDSALRFVIALFFTELHSILERSFLFKGTDAEILNWDQLSKFQFKEGSNDIPLAFQNLPEEIAASLGITIPEEKQHGPDVMELDDDDDDADDDNGNEESRKRKAPSEQEIQVRKKTKTTGNSEEDDDIKREPILEQGGGEPTGRSEVTSGSVRLLQDLNKTNGMMHCSFADFPDMVVNKCGVDLTENVDLIITDPPYNVRRLAGRRNSDYDVLTMEEMEECVEVISTILKPGGHGVLFCSDLQFSSWYKALRTPEFDDADLEADPNGHAVKKSKVFEVERHSLKFVRKPGVYTTKPVRRSVNHVNVSEIAIHFWKVGLTATGNASKVNYSRDYGNGSIMAPWTNVMTNIPAVPQEEVVTADEDSNDRNKSGPPEMFRPEQKAITWIMDLVQKFSKPGDIVVDLFSGTYSTFHACLLCDEPRRFYGCDLDESTLDLCEERILESYARQLLNVKSKLTPSSEQLKQDAQEIVRDAERFKINKRVTAWSTPDGLSPVQNFPIYIIKFLADYYMDQTLYVNARMQPITRWSNEWYRRLNLVDVKALRALVALNRKVQLRPSTIKSESAGIGVFADDNFDKDHVVGYYYGSIVYGDIGEKRRLTKVYGEGVMAVTSADYTKWAVEISGYQFVARDGSKFTGWICPAPWCVVRYINDPRYLENDKATENERKNKPRTANVICRPASNCPLNRDFQKCTAIQILTTRRVRRGEELFLNYGKHYDFTNGVETKSTKISSK